MILSALIGIALLLSGSCFGAEPAFGPEGTSLETGSAPSDLTLLNGVTVRASPKTTGTVYDDHLVVDQGAVRIGNFTGYTLDAKQLHIQTPDPSAQAIVRVSNDTIEIASLGGSLNVSQRGAMLAHVTAGTRVAFKPKDRSSGYYDDRNHHVMLWIIVGVAAAALAIGLTAAAQGRSPF